MSKYSILLQWSKEDKAYIATVPELPGLSAFGSSPDEAIKELSIAQELYLEVLQEDGYKQINPIQRDTRKIQNDSDLRNDCRRPEEIRRVFRRGDSKP